MKGLVVERDPGDRLKTKTVTEGIFEDLEEEQELLALDLVKRVLTKTRGVLLQPLLHLLGDTPLGVDGGPVIQITCLRALEPHVFGIFILGHVALAS